MDEPLRSADQDEAGRAQPALPEVASSREGPGEALERTAGQALVRSDPLRRYLAEVSRYPLLTPEEEFELAVRYRRHGDPAAAYRLATGNLRLVVHIARDFHRTAVSLLDLIQEGNLGLLQAVKRFDPYRKVRFSAYASWWIRAYILKYLLDHWSVVRVGTTNTRRRLLFNLRKERAALEARGIHPEPRVLAERLGVSEQELQEVEQAMSRDLSLDLPLGDDSETRFGDRMPSPQPPVDEVLAEEEFQEALRQRMETFATGLDERDRDIFRSRLLAESPATLQEIGDRHGISREAVRQRETRIVERLKPYLRRELTGFREFELLGEAEPGD